jgi:hypothetical protein
MHSGISAREIFAGLERPWAAEAAQVSCAGDEKGRKLRIPVRFRPLQALLAGNLIARPPQRR